MTPARQYPELPLVNQAVVARTSLARAKRVANLLDDAQRRAKHIISRANTGAEARRARAYDDGYEAGLAQAAVIAARYFVQCENLQVKLYDQVVNAVQHTMALHLDEPEWLLRVTAAFTRQRETYRPLPMRIAVPPHAKGTASALRRQFEQAGVSADIAYGDTPSFIIEWGDEIVEFDAQAVARTICDAAFDEADRPPMPAFSVTRPFLESVLQELDATPVVQEPKE
ncbi:hypothetical protein ACJ51O_37030 (plasmid) [Burkholderia pyrrocinia]|uniref:hypothetical protein n=1 Tax=Burkholderia pyrrocinia TaxID=60550 RepID=UPI0038B663C1